MNMKRDEAKKKAIMRRPAAAKPANEDDFEADAPVPTHAKPKPKPDKKSDEKKVNGLPNVTFEDLLTWRVADKKATKNAFASRAYGRTRTRAINAGWPTPKAVEIAREAYQAAAAIHEKKCK